MYGLNLWMVKNVFDFVDPDILRKLERIEKEEDEIRNKMDVESDDEGRDSSSDLSEDMIEAHEEVMENKRKIKKKTSVSYWKYCSQESKRFNCY